MLPIYNSNVFQLGHHTAKDRSFKNSSAFLKYTKRYFINVMPDQRIHTILAV
jgi:hypothetical protein